VDAEERRARAIGSRDFHGYKAGQRRTAAGASIAFIAGAGDLQVANARDQLKGE